MLVYMHQWIKRFFLIYFLRTTFSFINLFPFLSNHNLQIISLLTFTLKSTRLCV